MSLGTIGLLLPAALVAIGTIAKSDELHLTPDSLVDGVLARAEAIFSGRFEYRVTSGDASSTKQPQETRAGFILSGPSWRIDDRGFHVESINYRGKYYEVRRTPQPDGSTHTSLEIRATQDLFSMAPPRPPYFAGTLWHKSTIEYIRLHKSSARVAGEKTIAGIPTSIIEWDISASDKFGAFHAITQPLMNGGVLRLFVAPQLGYALPRVEHVDRQGNVETRFEATGFREVNQGIYMPKFLLYQVFEKGGAPGWYNRYEVVQVDGINQPIPDEAFSTSLPIGTVVADRATNTSHDFVVGNLGGSLADVDARIENAAQPRWRVGRYAMVVGSAIGILFCITVLIWRRVWRPAHRRAA